MSEAEDFTGRKRLARNVVWSWAGHLVFVVSGFVMPRMIDEYIGQEQLGIWDFCWSLVSYLNLASLGVGSSVNRYVAKYRAAGETDALCRAISSVVVIQLIIGMVVIVATAGMVLVLPEFFADRLGDYLVDTQVAIAFLGLSLAVQMGLDAFRGVISGCHRWDLHNGVQAASYAVTIVGMLAALMHGGNIVSLAIVYFAGTVLGETARVILAFRVCPELRIRRAYASWTYGRQMMIFGGKVLLLGVPPLIVFQTVNVQIAAALGPAALAIFSRPVGLVRHSETLLAKFSYMLAPMAGSLQGANQQAEQRELLLYGARWSVALALPAALVLAVLGDPLIALWMGPSYVHAGLMPLLSLGMFLSIGHASMVQVLVGMNLHGRVGVVNAAWVFLALVVGVLVLNHVGWSLLGAGALMVCAIAPSYGILLPTYVCRRLHVSFREYMRKVFLLPSACGTVFVSILLGARMLLRNQPIGAVLTGVSVGGLVLGGLYWRLLLTGEQRAHVVSRLHRLSPLRAA